MLSADLTKRCKDFILAHWGKEGLKAVESQPVSWVRHQANPQLKQMRRKDKDVPLINVRGEANRIFLALSTEAAVNTGKKGSAGA